MEAVKTNLFCIIQSHKNFEPVATDSSGKRKEISKMML